MYIYFTSTYEYMFFCWGQSFSLDAVYVQI